MADALAVVTTMWGLVMGVSPALQIRVIIRERDSTGTSMGWITILLIGFVLWFAYGLVNRDLPIILTNLVNITMTASLMATTVIYDPRKRRTRLDSI